MITKAQKKGTVRVLLTPKNGAKTVAVAGEFTDWKPVAMKKQKDGRYSVTVAAPAGTYEYKFIVDDQWIVDPENGAWALNPYGTMNSVIQLD